jgi:hypothetical protein
MKKTYHGSCHCKAVTFEADIDLDHGTGKCNCTFCWKQRNWSAGQLKASDFRLRSGEAFLADYARKQEGAETHSRFCSKCGIRIYGHGHIEAAGGDFVSVYLAALDDLPVESLVAAPVQYMDGLHDNWWNAPDETRHL